MKENTFCSTSEFTQNLIKLHNEHKIYFAKLSEFTQNPIKSHNE